MKQGMEGGAWERIRAAFERAVELPATEQQAWLAAELADAPDVRREVERLLAADAAADADSYLAPPGEHTLGDAAPTGLLGPRPGDRLGPYRLVRLIGQGGMGAVFAAEQDQPARTVALKVMRHGLGSARALRRFRDEIAVLARLRHPAIAQVFEAGDDAGVPWFAMELLDDAVPITAFAERRGLGLAARLALLQQVAGAIEHAHQRGVIHCDLKPANILVDADGRPKVIDFGIARRVDALARTATNAGELQGTLLYMSPERLVENDGIVDVRSDVYGLGVVLYELATGQRPFDLAGLSLAAACRRLVEAEPPAPSRRVAGLPVELDWIVRRALAKERNDRYASIAEFAADLARFERHEPLTAAPPSTAYRLRKLLRRHRTVATAGAVVTTTAVAAFVAVALALVRARAAEAAERKGREEATANARHAEEARAFLLDVFSIATPNGSTKGPDVPMGQALQQAARRNAQRFGTDLMGRIGLAQTLGLAYHGLGDYDQAAHNLDEALAMRREHFPADSRGLVELLVDRAETARAVGRLDDMQRALDEAEALLRDHPDARFRQIVEIHRANEMLIRGDKRAAIGRLGAAIAALERDAGPDDTDALNAHNLLGGIHHALGELDAAEREYQAAATGLARTKGPEHPATLMARQNLAMVRFSRDHAPEALDQLAAVLDARTRVLGEEHEETIGTMSNLGAMHYILGDMEHAAPHWNRAYELAKTHLPPTSPVLDFLRLNVAALERTNEHWDRAIEIARETTAARQQSLGPGHDRTLTAQTFLAETYRQAGRLAEARAEYAAAAAAGDAAKPPDLPNAYRCHLGLGRIALAERRFADAERELLACRDGFAAATEHLAVKSMLVRVDADLLNLYTLWGKDEEAARYRATVQDANYRDRVGTHDGK